MWAVNSSPVPLPTSSQAHIRMLYRLEVPGNINFIGFAFANAHPGFGGSVLESSGYNPSDPLYVLVGYAYDGTWESGKGYRYDIPIPGVGGGILLDTFLYDNQGNKTDLPVPNGILGEHLISSGEIRLIPTVSLWDDQTPTNVLDH
jgi:hypothetical protein